MNKTVHYMITRPGSSNTLIYPSEYQNQHYFGNASFYLLSTSGNIFYDEYRFYARLRDELLRLSLSIIPRFRRQYLVSIPQLKAGVRFYVKPLNREISYGGEFDFITGMKAIAQVIPMNTRQLEVLCKEYRFYFIGYSNFIRDELA